MEPMSNSCKVEGPLSDQNLGLLHSIEDKLKEKKCTLFERLLMVVDSMMVIPCLQSTWKFGCPIFL